TCTVSSLEESGTVVVSITGTIASDFIGTLTNTAGVRSNTPDNNNANNFDIDTANVGPASADLTLSKAHQPVTPTAGTVITYNITVTNTGPTETTSTVSITDRVPSEVTVGGTRSSPGVGCTTVGQDVTCTVAALNEGQVVTVTITGTVSSSAIGTITNRACVSSATPDPDPSDNCRDDVATI